MTREEAIKDIQDNILPIVGGKSLRMAIEALQQSDHIADGDRKGDHLREATKKVDTISRHAAIEIVDFECGEWRGLANTIEKRLSDLPSAEPEITDIQAIEQLQASGWMQSHDKQMYEAGLKERLSDDGDSYDALSPPAQPEPCDLCSNLEKGDTLYQSSDWDGGIGFDYIRDIQFCPKCGRRLEK